MVWSVNRFTFTRPIILLFSFIYLFFAHSVDFSVQFFFNDCILYTTLATFKHFKVETIVYVGYVIVNIYISTQKVETFAYDI